MMRTYCSLCAPIVLILQSFARTSNCALLLLGGGSKIYVDSHDQSPVLKSVEIIGCSASSLPDYPMEVFGTNMIWMEKEDVLRVCGGADWKRAYENCYMWNPRKPASWTPEPSLNIRRAFGFFAYLPDTMCKKMKLFIFGGLDPSTSKPVLETETFDEEEGIWTIHKSLPVIENHVFQNGADSGCLVSLDGVVYSVGDDIISVDWRTLKVNVITELEVSAQGEGCVFLHFDNADFGFFFLSGDWYSLKNKLWSAFAKPEPAFNIVRMQYRPTILGTANLNVDCKSPVCKGKILYGDSQVFQLDVEKNSWDMVGTLKHARLGYTSAVEVPHYVCDLLEYAENIDLDDFSSELLDDKMNAIIKTMSWRVDNPEYETLPTLKDELFEDPDCVHYSEVELQRTSVDEILKDKAQTLYAKSSSDFCYGEITFIMFLSLLVYLFK